MKLLDRLRLVGERRHLAQNTIDCYARWVREFLVFHRHQGQWVPPQEMGAMHVERFLTHQASDRRVAASTQNQACNAIVFLYRQVLADELPEDHLGRFVAGQIKRDANL